ncbi:MAG: Sec-independent protein translocase subunit TatA/TatB [Planctomycetota bacterium]|jgi:sec-independent protein translocase protein TatA
MPFNLGFGELFVLAIVAILVFGGRLPEVARKVGRGISEFKSGMSGHLNEIRSDLDVRADLDAAVEDTSADTPPDDWEPPPQDENCPGMS